MVKELLPDQLHRACDPGQFSFRMTTELPVMWDVIGQPRGTRALEFGIDIDSPGYNVFVLGTGGTGRTTTIQRFLAQRAAAEPVPDDWVYVNNFHHPRSPRAIRLPCGLGARFRDDMISFVAELRQVIRQTFEAESYREFRNQIEAEYEAGQEEMLHQLEACAQERGFTVLHTASGLNLVPVKDGQPLSPEVFHKLPEAEREQFAAAHRELEGPLEELLCQLRQREREMRQALQALDREIAASTVAAVAEPLEARYEDQEEIGEYLEEVRSDFIEQIGIFRALEHAEAEGGDSPTSPFHRYTVNLFVDNSQQQGAPVIVEYNPDGHNLGGRIEHEVRAGSTITDFSLLKAGILHQANGGYLVLRARDILADGQGWEDLKRALADGVVRVEERGTTPFSVVTPDPEPIPLEVKLILVGTPSLYYYLYATDEDFRKLFKVKAEFSDDMERTSETEHLYALFIRARCAEEELHPFEAGGVARVVEYGSRLAEDQGRLSTRFGEIADLLREASYWAGETNRDVVGAEDVERAIQERIYRANRVEEEVRRIIADGTLRIVTEGRRVGQINGLALNTVGDYTFGRPTRITAQAYVGRNGVVDIQREVNLSAPSHGKGVLTLSGYLGGHYATQQSLSISASLSFEQLYDEVHGDSASLAELYALLSALSDLPVRQGIAVTGSVDQQGEVQAVGGVTEKIEGFFEVCSERGLTGDQGVIVPAANCHNLTLCEEVVQAVAEGKFHVYPIASVDEGIELLTDVPAGEADEEGGFPEDSVHGRVAARLEELAERLEREGRKPPRKSKKGGRGA